MRLELSKEVENDLIYKPDDQEDNLRQMSQKTKRMSRRIQKQRRDVLCR
jgi:TolA-binding protein